MDNSKSEQKALNSERLILNSRKFTAHRFKKYRKARGLLVRRMREKRGLVQKQLGTPATIRRYESGEAAQVDLLEILSRMVPCPREVLHFLKVVLVNLPVACVKCRDRCDYKGSDGNIMAKETLGDITLYDFDD